MPARLWYTPLLLAGHQPDALSAVVPCKLPSALPRAERPLVVLATARDPERVGGLALTLTGDRLAVKIGTRIVDQVNLGADDGNQSCAYRLRLARGQWSVEGGPDRIAHGMKLEMMPIVNGLFSELDLHSGTPPSINVTTSVHATRTATRQAIAWTLATLSLAAALLLVSLRTRRRRGSRLRGHIQLVVAHARPADAVVGLVLIGWWVVGPAFWDDGWILAKQTGFSASHGFTTYFTSFATTAPLGYWLDWTQHWLSQSTNALIALRAPALVALAATWVVCRWILHRILVTVGGESRAALWSLAAAFSIGGLAWGMTLRPEPAAALLVTIVMACMVRFLERGTIAPLAIAAVFIPLALTVHPAGIVSIAPVIVAAPRLFGWARSQLAVAATIVTAASALLLVLAFLGSDIDQRRADAQTIQASGVESSSWGDEIRRYALLGGFPFGTPVRRGSVALMAVVALSFVLGRGRTKSGLLNVPAAALIVGLLLFIATPSKWPWHFGALIGLLAVAAGAEAARLSREATRADGPRFRPMAIVAGLVVAALWSWSVRDSWNTFDLSTLNWTPGFEADLPLDTIASLLPIALVTVLTTIASIGQRGPQEVYAAPWRVASWAAPVLVVPLIAFTVLTLVVDAAKTNSWTVARQNIDTLRGEVECGLADDAFVVPANADRDSVSLARLLDPETSSTLVIPNTLMYFPCVQLPRLSDGVAEVPDAVVTPRTSTIPVLYTASPFFGLADLYRFERLRWIDPSKYRDITVYAVDQRIPGSIQASPVKTP